MRLKTLLSNLLAAAMAFNLPLATQAATVSYSPVPGCESGLMQGEAPISKVGKLKLEQGVARLNGSKVEIVEKNASGEESLLSGVLISPALDTHGKQAKYEALAYFQDGSALNQIADPSAKEQVELTDNSLVTGKIDSIGSDAIVVDTANGQQTVKLDQVAEIRSPKLFKTTLIAQADSTIEPGVPFIAQAVQTQTAPLKPDIIIHEKVTPAQAVAAPTVVQTAAAPRPQWWKAVLATVVGGCLLATAIAVPLGVCLGGGGDHRFEQIANYNAVVNFQRNQNIFASQFPFATPVNPFLFNPFVPVF
jgi:lipopolysaccharide export system protein LptA